METVYASRNPLTGSSGFTNFSGSDLPAGLREAARRFPGHIVVDGNDDFTAPRAQQPGSWEQCPVKPVALFHSGISGISRSGWIIKSTDLQPLAKWHAATFGGRLADHGIRVHPLMLRTT